MAGEGQPVATEQPATIDYWPRIAPLAVTFALSNLRAGLILHNSGQVHPHNVYQGVNGGDTGPHAGSQPIDGSGGRPGHQANTTFL